MTLTESEADFVKWMDEVDLEEINLLSEVRGPRSEVRARGDDFGGPAGAPSNQLKGDGQPQPLPARDTGWKTD